MVRYLVLAMVLASAACGPAGRDRDPVATDAAVDANVDANVPVIDAAPAQCYDQSTDVDVALQIQIEQGCAIWNSLAGLAGVATVSRSGTTMTIDFGDGVVFTGPITGTMVRLVYEHQHPFTDGCGWKATETLVGQLDPTTCNFTLSYDYVESVVVNNGGCATPCSAQANVDLQLTPIP